MGRLATVVLVGAVVLLGVAAIVDALRGGGETAAPAPAAATSTDVEEEDIPRVLRAAGIGGVLSYTDPDDCGLHAMALPTMRPVEADRWESCAFAQAATGPPAIEGTVFSAENGLQAAEVQGAVEIVRPHRRTLRFVNAHAPAFRADGTLTMVLDGELVAWEPCEPGTEPRPRLWPGHCPRVLTDEHEVTEGLDPSRLRPVSGRFSLEDVVWLEDGTALAVARAIESDVLVHIQLTGGEHPIVNARFQAGRIYEVALDPRGDYLAVLSGTGRVAVLDPLGRLVASPGLKVRAMTWSPEGRWLAVLSGPGLVFVRPESPVTQIGPILLAARDLGWR
jgi:hypothetical protein